MFGKKEIAAWRRAFAVLRKHWRAILAMVSDRNRAIVDLFIMLEASNNMMKIMAAHPMGGQRGDIREAMREINEKVIQYRAKLEKAGMVKAKEEKRIVTPGSPGIVIPKQNLVALH